MIVAESTIIPTTELRIPMPAGAVAPPTIGLPDAIRLLTRARLALRAVLATDRDDPVPELQRAVIERLHGDISAALVGS